MATRQKRVSLKTPEGIACFANVFVPRVRKDAKGNPKGDPKYGLVLVFDKRTDISEIQDEVERVAIEKFGSKAVEMLARGKLNNPIRDAEDYEEHGAPFDKPGGIMISFKTSDQPGVVDEDAEPLMSKSDFYSGCLARVSYRAFAYDNESKGVGLALVNVQKLGEGERLSGNPNAEDDFADAKPAGNRRGRASRDEDEDTKPARRTTPRGRNTREDNDDLY